MGNYYLFWERIASLLAGRKQSWLLDQINVSSGTFSTWKREKRMPKADKVISIAKALGVSYEYLVNGVNDEIVETPKGNVRLLDAGESPKTKYRQELDSVLDLLTDTELAIVFAAAKAILDQKRAQELQSDSGS